MVGDCGWPADGEQVEPVADALGHLVDGERAGEAGGELDRQRQAVDGTADGGHRDIVAVRADAASRAEQLDGGVELEWFEADHLLTVDPQRDPTGDEHGELRAGAEEGLDGGGDRDRAAARSCPGAAGQAVRASRDATLRSASPWRSDGAPIRVAISSPTDAGSVTVASSTSCTSTPALRPSVAATSTASRVLPTPAGPDE